jgi:hypothetical protein
LARLMPFGAPSTPSAIRLQIQVGTEGGYFQASNAFANISSPFKDF